MSYPGDAASSLSIPEFRAALRRPVAAEHVASFQPSPEIQRLDIRFDIGLLRDALAEVERLKGFSDDVWGAIPLTQKPGHTGPWSENDLSGLYHMRSDERYQEEAFEEPVDEALFSEFVPDFADTYFAEVHATLSQHMQIGRMRILRKVSYNANSWHRDPEPRLHIPILTNPGSLFIVNNHCTHLPADGHVYFTDTRGYHTAVNGGLEPRVHIVAALPEGLN